MIGANGKVLFCEACPASGVYGETPLDPDDFVVDVHFADTYPDEAPRHVEAVAFFAHGEDEQRVHSEAVGDAYPAASQTADIIMRADAAPSSTAAMGALFCSRIALCQRPIETDGLSTCPAFNDEMYIRAAELIAE